MYALYFMTWLFRMFFFDFVIMMFSCSNPPLFQHLFAVCSKSLLVVIFCQFFIQRITHTIHVCYIYLHEKHKKSTIHVGKYNIPYMDGMGYTTEFMMFVMSSNEKLPDTRIQRMDREWFKKSVQFWKAKFI